MRSPREEHRVGIDYVHAVTALLQRARNAHPTEGLYEAADLQWWWRTPRPTDELPQLFWFDHRGRPEAAVILTAWSDHIALDPILMPNAPPDWVAHVVGRGLAHARALGVESVSFEVGRSDGVMREVVARHGFAVDDEGAVETWLAAEARPDVSPLHDGYRLVTRLVTADRPHHMIGRGGPAVETRLRQTSLYRPDLDLLVLDGEHEVAVYGLFWFDPVTATGLVEPMRTEDEHQRRGLARHVLTTGIELLARAGAERIKIVYEPANAVAGHLYLGVGFEPVRSTDVFAGRVDVTGSVG